MAAQAIIPIGSRSDCNPADRRGHFWLFAGAWAVDAPTRTRFVRARRAGAAKTDREDDRMDRAQMDRASTRKKRAMTRQVPSRFDSRLCCIQCDGCDSKANAMNNPGLGHNCHNIFLSRISWLIHFVPRVNLEAEV